jgi:hypothetical protein
MKRLLSLLSIVVLTSFYLAGCGSGGTSITGPILSMSEIKALKLDQLFINAGMEDEYRDYGEFAIYIRDAATDTDVACTSQEDGMSILTAPGVYYAELSVPLREVDGEHPSSVARFKIIFVEKDGAACPAPIDSEDDIAGESAELTFDQLVDGRIWATNGLAAAVLRSSSEDELSVVSMAPSIADGLAIDKLYFEDGSEESARYYIFAEKIVGGDSVYQCQIEDQYMEKIRMRRVLYAALGFPISCFDPADPGFVNMEVRMGLYIQTDSGPELVGQTEPTAVGDLVGERVDFTNNKGYMTFRRVTEDFFGAPVVRLADLAETEVTYLELASNPATDSPLELFAIDPLSGVAIACAGAAQGFVGIGAAGSYAGLAADLVALDGQMELFGSSDVVIKLVERTDGEECPKVPESIPDDLDETLSQGPSDLMEGEASFAGGGRIEFVRRAGGS